MYNHRVLTNISVCITIQKCKLVHLSIWILGRGETLKFQNSPKHTLLKRFPRSDQQKYYYLLISIILLIVIICLLLSFAYCYHLLIIIICLLLSFAYCYHLLIAKQLRQSQSDHIKRLPPHLNHKGLLPRIYTKPQLKFATMPVLKIQWSHLCPNSLMRTSTRAS